jgi:hypothetical protein
MDQNKYDHGTDLICKYSTTLLRWANGVAKGNDKEIEREEEILNALLKQRAEYGINGSEFERGVYRELERMEDLWKEALKDFEGETPKRAELAAIRMSLKNYPDPIQRSYRSK